jgi:hypothetical protein
MDLGGWEEHTQSIDYPGSISGQTAISDGLTNKKNERETEKKKLRFR